MFYKPWNICGNTISNIFAPVLCMGQLVRGICSRKANCRGLLFSSEFLPNRLTDLSSRSKRRRMSSKSKIILLFDQDKDKKSFKPCCPEIFCSRLYRSARFAAKMHEEIIQRAIDCHYNVHQNFFSRLDKLNLRSFPYSNKHSLSCFIY